MADGSDPVMEGTGRDRLHIAVIGAARAPEAQYADAVRIGRRLAEAGAHVSITTLRGHGYALQGQDP